MNTTTYRWIQRATPYSATTYRWIQRATPSTQRHAHQFNDTTINTTTCPSIQRHNLISTDMPISQSQNCISHSIDRYQHLHWVLYHYKYPVLVLIDTQFHLYWVLGTCSYPSFLAYRFQR
jgi:hypothetical protein